MEPNRTNRDEESHDERSTDNELTHASDLTAFARDVLAVVAGAEGGLTVPQAQYGFERYGYEGRGGREIIDELVDADLLEIVHGDDNRERLVATSDGRAVLRDHTQWLLAKLDLRAVDAEHRLASAQPTVDGGETDA